MELAQETFANKDSLTIDEKLDKILEFNVLMSQLFKATENKLIQKMETFETKIDAKINDHNVKIMNCQVNNAATNSKAENNTLEITNLRNELNAHISTYKKATTLKDLKSREHNLIIGNLPDQAVWETREQSMKAVRDFLTELFAVNSEENPYYDPDCIEIEDAHRVPQSPVSFFTAENKNGRRKMVFRVKTIMDKKIILKRCCDLKTVNATSITKLYVDRHYPKVMQDQQKILRKKFNRLRKEKKNPKFKVDFDKAEMCIELSDGKKIFANEIPPPPPKSDATAAFSKNSD